MWEDAPRCRSASRPDRPHVRAVRKIWSCGRRFCCAWPPSALCCSQTAGWPAYPVLRRAFAAATQPEQSLLLGEERGLLKFTEQTAEELANSARSMWDDFTACARDSPHAPRPADTARLRQRGQLHPGLCALLPAAGALCPQNLRLWLAHRAPWAAWATISTLAMTWQQPGARRYWPPQTAWCARRAAIKAMATMSASCTPTATRRCTHICNTCLSARGSA